MKNNLNRRSFITKMATGVTGGFLISIPGIAFGKNLNLPKNILTESDLDEMILIPSGNFLKGTTEKQVQKLASRFGYHSSWLSHESPQQKINLPDYKIDKYPVTNKQYYDYCLETGHTTPKHWINSKPADEILTHPVSYVNKEDAMAYAKWIGKRLPTEAEWEKAARGTDGRMFPWGDIFNPEACCWNRADTNKLTTDPVNAHPSGASPYGVMDMAGNLFEWCMDGPADESQLDRAVKYSAFLKGGAWITTEILDLRPAARANSGHINNLSTFYGFRCVI